MKAAQQTSFDSPLRAVEVVELAEPVPGDGEALVEVLAAPINPADLATLNGTYGVRPKLPAIPGMEGVGRVLEVRGDSGLEPGTVVLLPAGLGTWRERLTAKASRLTPLPKDADVQQLAMLSINPPTAELLLRSTPLSQGDWVAQNGANSAVGRYVITLAKKRGLRTLNIVRRQDVVEELIDLGGDVVLVDGDDLAVRARKAVGDERPKVGFDCVAGAATAHLQDSLADGSTVYVYGAMSGSGPIASVAATIFRDVRLEGFWLSRWTQKTPIADRQSLYAFLAGEIASGTLSAPIDATFPLSQLHDALRRSLQGGRSGKVLLTPVA
jgi:NADPH:quinone reductase-like Zn-dependent oxidoreductase